jgi:transposase
MRGFLSKESRLQATVTRLKQDNAKLRQTMAVKIAVLETVNAEQAKEIETLKLQLEELRHIVFGKKKKPKDPGGSQPTSNQSGNKTLRASRNPFSYRRPVPTAQEITEQDNKPMASLCCLDCHTPLINIRWIIRYLEDILLPVKKTVKRLKIQVGFCPKCRRQRQAAPVSAHTVTLGNNIRQAVLYWTYVSRLSFQQTIDIARDFYNLKISQGEIANILQQAAGNLAISYEQLKDRVRGSPAAHLDETTYQQQGGEKYAWVMTPVTSEEAVFIVGRNRGKGNAEKLMGNFCGTRITDCYSVYDNMAGDHQACLSHPTRQARDLANADTLPEDKRIVCQNFYGQLAGLYEQVEQQLKEPFEPLKRTRAYEELRMRLLALAETKTAGEPKKLLNLKERLKNYAHEFLTCLLHDNVPADNNKAERKLRHLVLKRKVSFGTRSDKGSEAFSINASVLLSWWWNDRDNFFANLSQALQGQ